MIYLSIVIPVYNEEEFIIDTLHALVSQDYPKERYELIVVDGRSSDGTRKVVNEFIEKYPTNNIRILDNPGRLSSRARNLGIRESKGELIGVIDGHVYIPDDQLFRNMERIKIENNALCLARPAPLDVPGLGEGVPYWVAAARKSWIGHSRDSYIYSSYEGVIDPVSSGFAYDRNVFDKIGYFDESFDAAEDVEFHHRLKKAGIMAYTSPVLLIYSYPRDSFRALYRQQMRYGEGRARFVKKHPEGFTKETPIPALLFMFFAALPLAMVIFIRLPALGAIYWAVFLLYWSVVVTTGFKEALSREKFFPGILVALSIWITHMGLGWGFLKTMLSSTKCSRRKFATHDKPKPSS